MFIMKRIAMMNAPITNLAQPTTTDVPTEKKAVEETERKDEWKWEGSEEEAEYLEFQKGWRTVPLSLAHVGATKRWRWQKP